MGSMTERKPAGTSFESWIDRQIREAEESGSFAGLTGAGKPIRGIDQPQRDGAWVAGYARRTPVPGTAFLPPALALARELEDLPQTLVKIRSEQLVRELLEDFNSRIREAHRSYLGGPPLRVRPLDIETTVADWRAARSAG
jgi:hypothetical protein